MRVAMACSTSVRIFAVGPVDGPPTGGKGLPTTPAGAANRAAVTSVRLVRRALDAGLVERVDDAVFAGRTDVMDGTGQGRRAPSSRPIKIREDLAHLADRFDRAAVAVGDDQADAAQPAFAQELGPEHFGLSVADHDTGNLAAAVLSEAGGYHNRLGGDAVVDTGLDVVAWRNR